MIDIGAQHLSRQGVGHRRGRPRGAPSHVPSPLASSVPPASSTSSSATRCAAAYAAPGSTPRSNRREASEDSLCRRDVRAMVIASKCAASITTLRVLSGQLGGRPAHHPGQPDRAGVVGDHQVVGVQRADHVVEGGQLLPFDRLADHDRAVEPVGVVGVDRLPGLQHHVVGDVDGQRDRPHPGQLDPAGQPARARPAGSIPVTVSATKSGQASDCSSTG